MSSSNDNASTITIATPAGLEELARSTSVSNEPLKIEVRQPDGTIIKRPYYGKCQYKTGKCFNERTLKRNGDAHSLCEEHRIKQNLIQRRSDRKYQTVHAIRRRERSQRRAVLKKQVSMAVAQQLFYEHQQQKSMGLQMGLPGLGSHALLSNTSTPIASLAPPIQVPGKIDLSAYSPQFANSTEGLASPILSFNTSSSFNGPEASRREHETMSSTRSADKGDEESVKEETNGSPTGIDDFSPDSFLSICPSEDADPYLNIAPIMSTMSDKEMWSEDDIEFLQSVLLS